MQQSQTAVLERNTTFTSAFATEPFEVAWAVEARWFVQVLEHEGPELKVWTQVSPDGLTWVDSEETTTIKPEGLTTWVSREFGHWIRIRGQFASAGGRTKVRIYLALKG